MCRIKLKRLTESSDIPRLAKDVVEKCKLLSQSKVGKHSVTSTDSVDDRAERFGGTRRSLVVHCLCLALRPQGRSVSCLPNPHSTRAP